MKKALCLILCLVFALSLCSCGGSVDGVVVKEVDSQMYSQEEIDDAIDVVLRKFRWQRVWKEYALREVYYAGDVSSADHSDWAVRNDADDVIVINSTYSSREQKTETAEETRYLERNWILVRKGTGSWKLVDGGF